MNEVLVKTVAFDPQQILHKLTTFAVAHGGRWCFAGWPETLLSAYFAFHAHRGNLAFVTEGGAVVALGVAWRQDDDGTFEFDWQENKETGNTIYLAEAIATHPGALAFLVGRLVRRWPDYRSVALKARRKGKLVDLSAGYLQKIVSQEVRKHGHIRQHPATA